MKKRILSLILVLAMCLGMMPAIAFAEEETVAYVTIAEEGDLKLVRYPVTLTDVNKNGQLDIDDALYLAHNNDDANQYGGYESSIHETYGRGVTKLWSNTSGWYGYTLNGVGAGGADDVVAAGNEIYAWVYTNKINGEGSNPDQVALFDKTSASVATGEPVEVTLQPSAAITNGADVAVYKVKANHRTGGQVGTNAVFGADGKATVTFSEAGTYVITAAKQESSPKAIVAPYCEVTVSESLASTDVMYTLGTATGKPGDTVTVPVTVETDYATSMNSLQFSVLMGEGLELVGATSPLGEAWNISTAAGAVQMMCGGGVTFDMPSGEIMNLQIKINSDAQPGTYDLNLGSFYYKNGADVLSVASAVTKGSITVEEAEEPAAVTPFTVTVGETAMELVSKGKQSFGEGTNECETYEVTVPADTTSITVSSENQMFFYTPGGDGLGLGKSKTFDITGDTVYKISVSGVGYYYLSVKFETATAEGLTNVILVAPEGLTTEDGVNYYGLKTFTGYTFGFTTVPADIEVTQSWTFKDGGNNGTSGSNKEIEVSAWSDGTATLTLTVEDTNNDSNRITKTYYLHEAQAAAVEYDITVAAAEHGTITVKAGDTEVTKAAEGTEITVTATPADGYQLDKLTYTPDGGDAVDITEAKKFNMPASKVTVTATFKEEVKPYINITVGTVNAKPGETVMVPVTLDTDFTARAYQPTFTFTAENADVLTVGTPTVTSTVNTSDWNVNSSREGYIQLMHTGGWMGSGAVLPEGEIIQVPVTLAESAAAGEYELKLSSVSYEWYYYDSVADNSFVQSITNGKVVVESAKPKVTFSLGTVSGKPGETVKLPLNTSSSQEVMVRQIGFCPEFDRTVLSYPNGGSNKDITIGSALSWTSTVSASNSTFKDSNNTKWKYFYVQCTATYGYNQPLPQGTAFEISYKIAADAEPGSYEVNLVGSGVKKGTYITNKDSQLIDCDYVIVPGTVLVMGTLAAPVLTDATVTSNSVIVAAPAASAQDTNAKVEYRLSPDGTTWGEWQSSNEFTNLKSGTQYQIQARYVPSGENIYYADVSEASAVLNVTTEETKPYINITVGSVSGLPGETVQVPVVLDTDFDKKAYTPNYTFTAAEGAPMTVGTPANGKDLDSNVWYVSSARDGYIQFMHVDGWMGPGAVLPEGEIILVPVTIAENAEPGEYALNIASGVYEWYYGTVNDGDYVETLTAGTIKVRENKPYIDITVGDLQVYPGETIQIPVSLDTNFTKRAYQPTFVFAVSGEDVTISSVTEGSDLDTNNWYLSKSGDNAYQLNYAGGWTSQGGILPEGEILLVSITVAEDAEPGERTLSVEVPSYEWYYYDYVTADDYVQELKNGTITVQPAPVKTILDAPMLTAAEAAAYSIAVTAPAASAQDPNATVEYAISEDGQTYGGWQTRTLFENLKPAWEYSIIARYKAADTVWYLDSEASEALKVTTLDDSDSYKPQMTITIGNATVQHGDEVILPITFEHNLTYAEFKNILLSFVVENDLEEANIQLVSGGDRNQYLGDSMLFDKFESSNGYFLLVGGYTALSHSYELAYWDHGEIGQNYTLPEGEIFKLYLKIDENAVPGEYTIGLESKDDPKTPSFICSDYLHGTLTDKIELKVNPGKVTVKEPLTAPILTDYTATDDTITITAPEAVDGATIQYAISTDGENYGEWQTDNVFAGLDEKTTYYVIARYVVGEGHANADSYASEPLEVKTVNPTATYTLAEVTAKAGETVEVAVNLEHAIVKQATSFNLIPTATAGVELTAAKAGKDLPDGWKVMLSDGVVTVYTTEATAIPTGEIVVLTYQVGEETADGDYTVTLTDAFTEDGNAFIAADDSVLRVDGTVAAGKITVKNMIYGDINKDGIVDSKDLVSLRRYLAGWSDYTAETLDLTAANVNIDGAVSMTDAIILSRHLVAVADDSSWQDYKTLPYEK